jgi:hypothetical protein
MRRPSKSSSHRLSSDSQKLIHLAQGLTQSSSRVEERAWEHSLDALLQKLLRTGHQETLDAALNHLLKGDPNTYDTLMEASEANSESCRIEHEGEQFDALLVAAPILAWTRFSIAAGTIPADAVNTLTTHLHAHLLASKARLAVAPTLYSIDQLPNSHAETFSLTQRMAQAVLKDTPLRPLTNPPETAPFLADTRYVLAIVLARAGEPHFLWQESLNPADRERADTHWRAQVTPTVTRLLPGCNVELLLPEAYFVACREADKLIRPASIHAAVHYLTNTLGIEAQELRAIIGGFCEEPTTGRVDEYRIGFTLRHTPEVIYGVVWPLYEQEEGDLEPESLTETLIGTESILDDKPRTASEEILSLLRECGVVHIKRHSERFPMEFCDDCGAPLYPDPDAELVHAEMPEDAPTGAGHLH